ncbi:MAG: hypothetical protein VX278_22880, partial [Myxococcota bacterium]|nr:hypothetical protein [Myxococcota bacterium]
MRFFIKDSFWEFLSKEERSEVENFIGDKDPFVKRFKRLRKQVDLERVWRELIFLDIAKKCPFPLGAKLLGLIRQAELHDEGIEKPQFAFELCAVYSILVRYLAVLSLQSYVLLTDATDSKINLKIVKSIQKPKDNDWKYFVHQLPEEIRKKLQNKEVSTEKEGIFGLVQKLRSALNQKGALSQLEAKDNALGSDKARGYLKKKLTQNPCALDYILKYRNLLVHAEPLVEFTTLGAFVALQNIIIAFSQIWQYGVFVRIGSRVWDLKRPTPSYKGVSLTLPIEEREICLVNPLQDDEERQVLSLSPLMCVQQAISEESDLDDIYFINLGILESLTYIGFQNSLHQDGKSLGTYEQFKKYMAGIKVERLPPKNIFDFGDYAEDKAKLFVGREDVKSEIYQILEKEGGGYTLLKAYAGMGKTAIMAHLYQNHYYVDHPNDPYVWTFHFCMNTEGRNSALPSLRSLIAQICAALDIKNLKSYLTHDVKEIKDKFQSLLHAKKVQEALEERG